MKRILSAFLFLVIQIHFNISQGLIISPKSDSEYNKINQKYSDLPTDSIGTLPAKIDLSMYLPPIVHQSKYHTCVGVSSAYYMRTMLEAKRLGITDPEKIKDLSFSPAYLYNAIKSKTDTECEEGTEIVNALTFLKNNGTALEKQLPYTCYGANPENLKPKPESKILDFIKLFGEIDRRESVVESVKKALSEGGPVIIGITMTHSLENDMKFVESLWYRIKLFFGAALTEQEDFRLWKPSKATSGGHAVCVIGYDKARYGGAFQVVNSWGTWWGEQGKFWIKFSDFPTVTKYAFQAYLKPSYAAADIELSASLNIKSAIKSSENSVPYIRDLLADEILNSDSTRKLVAYQLLKDQEDKASFYIEANVDKQCYLYMISKNESDLKTPILFPSADSSSALIGANTKFLFPKPKWSDELKENQKQKYFIKGTLGKEYWLFLFSTEKLDIKSYVNKINKAKGSFTTRVLSAFGKDLVPHQQIEYNPKKLQFSLKAKHYGHIVPLIISFNHVEMNNDGFLF